MTALYTLAVYLDRDGEWVREFVNPDIQMPFHWADAKAADLNLAYPNRTYKAVNVNEVPQRSRKEPSHG